MKLPKFNGIWGISEPVAAVLFSYLQLCIKTPGCPICIGILCHYDVRLQLLTQGLIKHTEGMFYAFERHKYRM